MVAKHWSNIKTPTHTRCLHIPHHHQSFFPFVMFAPFAKFSKCNVTAANQTEERYIYKGSRIAFNARLTLIRLWVSDGPVLYIWLYLILQDLVHPIYSISLDQTLILMRQ